MCQLFTSRLIFFGSTADRCCEAPLRERRELLAWPNDAAAIPIGGSFAGQSAEEIESAFQLARRRLNEGLMVKDPGSKYTPGRRGLSGSS